MTWFAYLPSTRVPLPSSQCCSIQRGPPTRSGKNRVQHIQSGGATSPHSSLQRVSVLACSCCLFFIIFPCLVSRLLSSHVMESCVSWATTQNQQSDACQSRLAAQHTLLLLQHAESTHRRALRHVPFAQTHCHCHCAWLC